jgi:hypothetical protein
LVQFFETPLNIPEFKCLFLGEDALTQEEREIIANRKVKNEYKENEGTIREELKKFVDFMKEHLRLDKGNWENLKQKPWPLNYEYLWHMDFEHKTKYDGK